MHQLNLKRKTSTYAVSSNGSSNGSRLIGRPSFHLLGWASLVCLLVWLFLLKKLNGVFLIWEQYLGGTGSGSNGSKEGDASDSAILVEVWTWHALWYGVHWHLITFDFEHILLQSALSMKSHVSILPVFYKNISTLDWVVGWRSACKHARDLNRMAHHCNSLVYRWMCSCEWMVPTLARPSVCCISNRIAQSGGGAKEPKEAHKVFAAHALARKRQSNAVCL